MRFCLCLTKNATTFMAIAQTLTTTKKITENYILPQMCCLNEKVSHEELRCSRDEEALVKLKQRMEVIGMRRKAKEEKKKGN